MTAAIKNSELARIDQKYDKRYFFIQEFKY